MGEYNARITGEKIGRLCNKEDENSIWLMKEENQQQERCLIDNVDINQFGEVLPTLCNIFKLVVCNVVGKWKILGYFTCKTYNGASVIDYAICSKSLASKIIEVVIEEFLDDLKRDHNPIWLLLYCPNNYHLLV